MNPPQRIGRYEIEAEIGHGSMGVVYRALDPRIGRVVALKCVSFAFPLSGQEEEDFLRRFYHEAQIAGRLNHPNIVTIHDVGTREADGAAFIAMEFVTGTNLQELLAGGGRLPIPQVIDLARQAGAALDYAHAADVVHRDIKPGNLVVTPAGQLKILDFGIARLASGDNTHPGRLMGTPNYMAPEQVTGGQVDGRADQFALAVTLYHLLTGERPFSGESVTAISYQVVNVAPPPATRLNPSLPTDIDRVLGRAMSKNPEDRYPSCTEFAEYLAEAIGDWKGTASRTGERTLVSAPTAGKAAPLDGPAHGGLLTPRAVAGWSAGLVVLALLAAAPYLLDALSGPGRAATASAGLRGAPVATLAQALAPAQEDPPHTDILPGQEVRPPARAEASLLLDLQYRFDHGTVFVRLDGTEVLRDDLHGGGGKSTWTRDLQVEPGRHRLEVRVTDGQDIDEIEGIDLEVPARTRRQVTLTLGALTHRLKMRPDDPEPEKHR